MKIGVIGTGYVGLVSGACLAAYGHHVHCVDNNPEKVDMISNGKSPIYEPGLEEVLQAVIKEGRFSCNQSMVESVISGDVIFICVGTPMREDKSADLSYVQAVASEIGKHLNDRTSKNPLIVVVKSTVPPGTTKWVESIILKELNDSVQPSHRFLMGMCPEFLKEGTAVDDFMKPDRVVIGADEEYASKVLYKVFEEFVRNGNPVVGMKIISAELTKYAANCMLAARISLMNEFARLCDKTGANIEDIRKGIGTDTRIGKQFLYAGPGYGGSCFPKDVNALTHFAIDHDVQGLLVLNNIDRSNHEQKLYFARKVQNEIIPGDKVAVWGIAFKANTDDIRDSSTITLVETIKYCSISAFDPEGMENAKKHPSFQNVEFNKKYECLDGARILVIATEWPAFKNPDFGHMKSLMADNPVIVDGRNLYDRQLVESHGFTYIGIGR